MNLSIKNIYQNLNHLAKLKFKSSYYTPMVVDDKLIRGHCTHNLSELYRLKKRGVTQIIDLRNPSTELSEYFPQYIERLLCKMLNIKYNNVKYSHKLEKMPEMDFFSRINDKILSNDGITFMHCRHGKRRTGVCVAIYEKYHTGKSKEEILKELYNLGFRELQASPNEIPQRVYNRLTKIYNDFIEKFYPNEAKIK